MNLILAGLWLIFAGFLYYYELNQPGNRLFPIPLYVVAITLGLYNLVRWWLYRIARASQRQGEEELLPRKPRLHRASDEQREPDPNFVFSDPSQAAPAPPESNGSGTQEQGP